MSKAMNKKIENLGAVEIGEQELDRVAGGVNVASGLDVVIADIKGSISQAINKFLEKELPITQPTLPAIIEHTPTNNVTQF